MPLKKVSKSPAAMKSMADAINGLVDALNGMQGGPSVTIRVTEGKILILVDIDPTLNARVTALETSVATLNTLVSGLSRQTVTYCSGGSPTSKTILMS
jgi:hypothetical protein